MKTNGHTLLPPIKSFVIFAACSDGKFYRVPLNDNHHKKVAKCLIRIGGGTIVTEAKPLENPDKPRIITT